MKELLAIAGLTALAACMQPEVTDTKAMADGPVTMGPILTEAQFLATIADKPLQLVDDDGNAQSGRFVMAADGTWSGSANDNKFTGTWEWRDRYWCRRILTGGGPAPKEDCQTYDMISSNLAQLARDRGNGAMFRYRIDG